VLKTELSLEDSAALTLANLADGSVGRAFQLADTEEMEERTQWFERLNGLQKMPRSEVLQLADAMARDKIRFVPLLDLMRLYYRDLMVLVSGGNELRVTHQDMLDSLRIAASMTTVARVLEALELLDDASRALVVNTNRRLIAENLLTRLAMPIPQG